MSESSKDFFQNNKYVVIRQFLNTDTTMLLYQYCLIKAAAIDFKYATRKDIYDEMWDGRWTDSQVPHVYSRYGDPVMDSVLSLSAVAMSNHTGLNLLANYSYWRLYETGCVLKRHQDRASCEISATICLGYNNSNVSKNEYPDYNWPMWLDTSDGEIPVQLAPGDAIIYRGCEVDHWREPFNGLNHAQLFLHYSDADGPFKNSLDGRLLLGIPKENQQNVKK